MARVARLARNHKRRSAEQADAADFLTRPDHAGRCIFGTTCSRTYDPYPVAHSRPDKRLYDETGIGLLYGYGGRRHIWQLAGWNVVGLNDDFVEVPL